MRALVGLRPRWPRTVTSHAAEVSAAASDGPEPRRMLAKAKELLARGAGIVKMAKTAGLGTGTVQKLKGATQ